MRHSAELVYADDLDTVRGEAFEPIGIPAGSAKGRTATSAPGTPLKHKLFVDETARDTVPFEILSRRNNLA